jgi:hypothetical protein
MSTKRCGIVIHIARDQPRPKNRYDQFSKRHQAGRAESFVVMRELHVRRQKRPWRYRSAIRVTGSSPVYIRIISKRFPSDALYPAGVTFGLVPGMATDREPAAALHCFAGKIAVARVS